MPLVRTERLTKSFGALTAVNEVSIEVEEGSLHSVIGPNGAGKTTFFNLLTGQHTPTSGRIIFDGQDIAGTPPHRVAHLGIRLRHREVEQAVIIDGTIGKDRAPASESTRSNAAKDQHR